MPVVPAILAHREGISGELPGPLRPRPLRHADPGRIVARIFVKEMEAAIRALRQRRLLDVALALGGAQHHLPLGQPLEVGAFGHQHRALLPGPVYAGIEDAIIALGAQHDGRVLAPAGIDRIGAGHDRRLMPHDEIEPVVRIPRPDHPGRIVRPERIGNDADEHAVPLPFGPHERAHQIMAREPPFRARDIERHLVERFHHIGRHDQAPNATVSDSAPSIVTVVPVM